MDQGQHIGLIIGGVPIPFNSPLLLGVVALHFFAGLGAVVCGAAAMISYKGIGRHPLMGKAYFWCLCVICGSMAILAADRWPADLYLLVIGALAIFSAVVGRRAGHRRMTGWVPWHVSGMGMSYVLMLTAFYVDNGPHLPIWDRLPSPVYWLLPTAIGLPLIFRAIRKYRTLSARVRVDPL